MVGISRRARSCRCLTPARILAASRRAKRPPCWAHYPIEGSQRGAVLQNGSTWPALEVPLPRPAWPPVRYGRAAEVIRTRSRALSATTNCPDTRAWFPTASSPASLVLTTVRAKRGCRRVDSGGAEQLGRQGELGMVQASALGQEKLPCGFEELGDLR